MTTLNTFIQTSKAKGSATHIVADQLNNVFYTENYTFGATDWLNGVVAKHEKAIAILSRANAEAQNYLGFANGVFKTTRSLNDALNQLQALKIINVVYIAEMDKKGRVNGDLGLLVSDLT